MKDQNYNLLLDKLRTIEVLKQNDNSNLNYEIYEDDLILVEKCSVCECKDYRVLAEVYYKDNLKFNSLVSCSDCLFVYRRISPSLKWFQKCWKKIASDNPTVFNKEIETIRVKRYEKYYSMMCQYISSGKLLDVGSAYGSGASVFKDKGFEVNCIEAEDNKANYISRVVGLPVVSRTIEEFEPIDKYDVIIFAHCLEHLDDPKTILNKICDMLEDSGYLYLEVPLISSSMYWFEALYLTHKSYYSERNLLDLFDICGLEILELHYPKQSNEEPDNFGVLLRKNAHSQNTINFRYNIDEKEILALVRKNFPIMPEPDEENLIRYNVDRIEHFYQTARMDKSELLYAHLNNRYTFS